MGTTVEKDNSKYQSVISSFEKSASKAATGRLIYAGNLWPLGVVNPQAPGALPSAKQMRREIDTAFEEARAMVQAGYIKATAAVAGDEAAGLLMKKWFGRRQDGITEKDWWIGAQRILSRLQTRLTKDINLYYRGDDSLIGRPTDYPGETGNLKARDVSGYAEASAEAADGVIGLCKLFFRRESGGVFKTAPKGRDSIGGCLVHELSHNYCGTKDHDAYGGGDCYGESNCMKLARKRRRRAWYNADNIEYFCEDAFYGLVASKGAISTGLVGSLTNVRDMHQQVIEAMKPPTTDKKPLPGGPRAPTQVNGSVAMLRAQFMTMAVVRDPTLSVKDPQDGPNF